MVTWSSSSSASGTSKWRVLKFVSVVVDHTLATATMLTWSSFPLFRIRNQQKSVDNSFLLLSICNFSTTSGTSLPAISWHNQSVSQKYRAEADVKVRGTVTITVCGHCTCCSSLPSREDRSVSHVVNLVLTSLPHLALLYHDKYISM